jgi:adenylosuccinate lyase
LAEPTEQLSPFDAASPLDARYYLADADFFRELSPFVSEAAAVRFFADVEAALVETLSEIGLCPPEVAQDVRGRTRRSPRRRSTNQIRRALERG